MTLKEAVGKVLEGWTLPNSVRKILEEAYFAEPQRKPLTDEQKMALCKQFPDHLTFNAIHAIEAAHGIKE